jgi:hypothetical protein
MLPQYRLWRSDFSRRIRNHHTEVHSDNAGVVDAWKNRSSRNPGQGEILAQICVLSCLDNAL